MTKQKAININGVQLKINPNKSDYAPKKQKIVGYEGILKTLAYSIKTNKPVLMIGETGVGKTALIRHLAYKTNNPFRRLNLNGQTTVDEFVGKTLLNKEGTYWVDGVLTQALREGHWLLLDEINASLPEVLFVLHSLMDDDNYIVLAENKGEIVKPHPNFRLFCSMNPSGKYAGTKELNKAFLSRFPIVLQLDFPEPAVERKIIQAYAKITEPTVKNLVKMANDLRTSYKKNEIEFVCSTRDLINCAIVAQELKNMKKALALTILGRCEQEDRKAVSTTISLYFGRSGIAKGVTDYEVLAEKLKGQLVRQQVATDSTLTEIDEYLEDSTDCLKGAERSLTRPTNPTDLSDAKDLIRKTEVRLKIASKLVKNWQIKNPVQKDDED